MYVVAGASGHVGAAVAEQLLRAEKPVTVLVRDAAKGSAWAARGARVVVGVLEDPVFLARALEGATGLFALQPPNYADGFLAWQRALADSVATAVQRSSVPHVALLSSVGADLPSGTGAIQGQYYFENVLRKTGTVLSSFRSCYFQENVGNALGAARQGRVFPIFAPGPDEPFPHIATRDIGRFIAAALRSPPSRSEVIDLEGPAISHREVARELGAALGVELTIVQVPRAGWAAAFVQAGMSAEMGEIFAEMYGALAAGLLVPKGDRLLCGTTSIDETIRSLLNAPPPHGN